MEIFAESKNVRVSPRKMRLMADLVKKMPVAVALTKLQFLAKSGSSPMLKALKSAVANAQNNFKKNLADLTIKNIIINEGLKMKRQDKSHGARYNSGLIQKRASHIKVVLEAK